MSNIEDSLCQLANGGYNISLDGPDMTKVRRDSRWTLRCYTNECDAFDHPVAREMFHGESPEDVLDQAVAWMERRQRGEQP